MNNVFERVRAEERQRVADFLRKKGKEAHERMLAAHVAPAERAVAEMAGQAVEKLTDLIADMVRLGVMP